MSCWDVAAENVSAHDTSGFSLSGGEPCRGLVGKQDLIPKIPNSGADPVPPPSPAASPQPRNIGLAGRDQRDTGDTDG